MLPCRIPVYNSMNLVLTGHVCNALQCETRIKCQGMSGFEFQSIESINITALEFSGCGGGKMNGGALNVINVTFTSIFNCRFVRNGVRGLGGAVYFGRVFDDSIRSSYFINNSVQCNCNEHQSCVSAWNRGGAMFILDSRTPVLISTCHFEQNSAYTHGGAIASIRTTLVVIHTIIVSNQANTISNSSTIGFGGAIYVQNVNITILSSQYTAMKLKSMHGGAISVLESSIYISVRLVTFTSNTAHKASVAVAVSGRSSSIWWRLVCGR